MIVQTIRVALLALAVLWTQISAAEKVEFSEEELALESVLPVFDRPLSVMNRRVITAGRGEVGLFGGMNLNEPFYNPLLMGVHGAYHLTEEIGANIAYYSWMGGKSTYTDDLETKFDWKLDNLPEPEYSVLGNFQYTMYYGKMSLTKSAVLNLSLFAQGGGGIISFAGEASPVLTAGIGQKFYLGTNFAIRLDMRILSFEGPNLVSRDPSTFNSPAKPSDFDSKVFFYTLITAGVSYVF